jgi:hypothetical protein
MRITFQLERHHGERAIARHDNTAKRAPWFDSSYSFQSVVACLLASPATGPSHIAALGCLGSRGAERRAAVHVGLLLED